MSELAAWLRQKFDEDESLAHRIAERSKRPRAGESLLVEVESKRLILDAHPYEQGVAGGVCGTCQGADRIEVYWDGENETVERLRGEMTWPCPTMRALALPYAGRTGYREEWRP